VGELICNFRACDLKAFKKRKVDGELISLLPFTLQVHLGDKTGVLTVKALGQGKEIGSCEIKFAEN